MVCPKCKIMTQRLRRDNVLEHVCRYPACKNFGQVVARSKIPAPVIEEDGTLSAADGGTSPEVGGFGEAEAETTDA